MSEPIDIHALAAEVAALIRPAVAPAPLIGAEQAAHVLGVSPRWLLAEARANRVPHIRLGRSVRFDKTALLTWARARQKGPTQ